MGSKTSRLRDLIERDEVVLVPGVYDGVSVRIVEAVGFEAAQCSGYGFSAALKGKPDVGLTGVSEVVEHTKNICSVADIPVMADADTGYGNPVNVYHAVREFERAGAAGINIEDQTWPKRCGHMDGKAVIDAERMVQKVRAAVDAREDDDLIINARTDAIATHGVEEAIHRGNAYAEAGADLIFVEAPEREEDVRYVIEEIDAPVSINMLDGGKTPRIPLERLDDLGAARVSSPLTALLSAAQGMKEVLETLKAEGTAAPADDEIMGFEEFTDLVGLPEIREMEERYVPEGELDRRYD